MEPLIVKTMLQSKLVIDVDIPEMYPQLKVIQKSLVVDSSPKLTHTDWIREQSELRYQPYCAIVKAHQTEEICG